MPCYSPLNGYYKREDGQRKFTITRRETKTDSPELGSVSCGQCIGCKIQKAKDWAIRCAHEMESHDDNIFITLTYAQEPADGGLYKKHLQDFWKRLRKSLSPKKISYYACGEYGTQKDRPHYHAIVFGHTFEDREPLFQSKGNQIYTSKKLQKLWGHGHVSFAAADIGTAIYVSKYITKKHTGELARDSYYSYTSFSGEYIEKIPEYTQMSLKPAIGLTWLKKYYQTELLKGFLTHEGTKFRIPRYYKEQLEKLSPSLHEELMHNIHVHAQSTVQEDETYERLLAREKHAQLVIKQELRNLDNAN